MKTWRTIRQPAFTRSATALGWLKQAKKGLKLFLYAVLAGLLILGVLGGIQWMSNSSTLKHSLRHSSLAKGRSPMLLVKTDGVLSEGHIHAALALPADLGLLELDLKALKQKLSTVPEVKSVTLEKELPDKLWIYITEHNPMARVAFIDQAGKKRVLCISDEGLVFQPSLVSQALKTLPWLEGITLKPKDKAHEGFEAWPQLTFLAPLLEQARLAKPKLYAQFRSIQCEGIDRCSTAPWSVVRIKTQSWGEWVFATQDYPSQLEKLEAILAELSARRSKPIRTIDLSLEDQGIVSFF